MKKTLLTIFICLMLCSCKYAVLEAAGGPPSPPPPQAGTAAELTTGTETATRVWSPKILSDEYSGASAEVVDANVAAAGNGDTNHAYSKDDIHDYLIQIDTNLDGVIDSANRYTEGITSQTFGAADATPDGSFGGSSLVRLARTGGVVTITDIDDGDDHSEFGDGDWIEVRCDHAVTLDLSDNANMYGHNNEDWTAAVGDTFKATWDSTSSKWRVTVSAVKVLPSIAITDSGAGDGYMFLYDDTGDDRGEFVQMTGDGSITKAGVFSYDNTGRFVSKSANYTVGTTSTKECYGGIIYVTSAATITACDDLADGMHFCVATVGAIAVSADVQSDDLMYLDGTALDDGDKATNTSTTGDTICFSYYDATGWWAMSGSPDGDHWTDGGP